MNVRFGFRTLKYPSTEIQPLRESQDLLPDFNALRTRMADDGFLFIRGLIDREKVLHARKIIFEHMEQQSALVPNTPILEGVMPKGGRSVQMMGRKGIAHHPDVLAVLEGPELVSFFENYFQEPVLSFNYKWLRAVGNEQYTGAHFDYVYMGQGSKNLHTTWIPFGDIPVDQGTLAMCPGSHNAPGYARLRETYGQMDVDRDRTEGWFTKDPMEIVEQFGGQWQTSPFQAGDVILFGMHTMHASTTNLTNRFRLSCDIRFQPAADPIDRRWSSAGIGHYDPTTYQSIEAAREKWRL